jgi:hypothetical protein
MKCPYCGKNMIERPPDIIYTTNPPQWDRIMWCGGCDYSKNIGTGFRRERSESPASTGYGPAGGLMNIEQEENMTPEKQHQWEEQADLKEGDRVIVYDFSEAHGDKGEIYYMQPNGIVMVELDPNDEEEIVVGTLWPVEKRYLKRET